jgi:isopropylmalate/homocitrate/citramalate synthase
VSRGTKGDIDAVLKSGSSGISMIIPTSDLHIECKLRKLVSKSQSTEECAVRQRPRLNSRALAEDATRSDFAYLTQVFEGFRGGSGYGNSRDTGVLTPERAAEFFSNLKKPESTSCGALPQ